MVDAGAGIALGLPLFRGVLADALMVAGKPAEAVAEAEGALRDVASTGQYFFEPDLHWIRGECLLGLPLTDQNEAEACFRRSIETARRVGAKLLELRAAAKLARLAGGGTATKSRAALGKLYRGFTEGLDAPELCAARELLAASEPEGKICAS
jgi:adenylate cyclase